MYLISIRTKGNTFLQTKIKIKTFQIRILTILVHILSQLIFLHLSNQHLYCKDEFYITNNPNIFFICGLDF